MRLSSGLFSAIRQALKQVNGTSAGFLATAQVKEKLASVSACRDEVELLLKGKPRLGNAKRLAWQRPWQLRQSRPKVA